MNFEDFKVGITFTTDDKTFYEIVGKEGKKFIVKYYGKQKGQISWPVPTSSIYSGNPYANWRIVANPSPYQAICLKIKEMEARRKELGYRW